MTDAQPFSAVTDESREPRETSASQNCETRGALLEVGWPILTSQKCSDPNLTLVLRR